MAYCIYAKGVFQVPDFKGAATNSIATNPLNESASCYQKMSVVGLRDAKKRATVLAVARFLEWRVRVERDESEAVLNACAVIAVVFHAQVIGMQESAFGKGIFRFDDAVRVFPAFMDGIAGLNFSLALALNSTVRVILSKVKRLPDREYHDNQPSARMCRNFIFRPARDWPCLSGLCCRQCPRSMGHCRKSDSNRIWPCHCCRPWQ